MMQLYRPKLLRELMQTFYNVLDIIWVTTLDLTIYMMEYLGL